MFSLGSHLLSINNPTVVHSLVDSFFEGKKALVKERLMDSMRVIVDGLFEEMVGQVKEMLLPPKTGHDQEKPSGAGSITPAKPSITKSPMSTSTVSPSQPPKSKMIFTTKSKPGPSSSAVAAQPFSGLYKRMAEEDGFYTTSTSNNSTQPNKKKAITVELQIDGPLDDGDDYGDVALDEGADGSGDAEQLMNSSSANVINIAPNGSKAQVQKPIQAGKYACTEANCTRNFRCNTDLKRHLRTHNNVRPFGCTFPGCSLEFSLRTNAIRHILNVHLKKKSGEKDPTEPPDPATYLSTKEELL